MNSRSGSKTHGLDVSVGLRPSYWMGKIAMTWNLAHFPFHFPDSGLYLQNDFDFDFWWRDTENKQQEP